MQRADKAQNTSRGYAVETHNSGSGNNGGGIKGMALENEEPNDKNEQLIERVEIPESPFVAVRHDKKWFLTMGKYRLTEELESLEECEKQAFDTSWFRIMQIIGIMMEEYEVNKQTAKQALEYLERREKDAEELNTIKARAEKLQKSK